MYTKTRFDKYNVFLLLSKIFIYFYHICLILFCVFTLIHHYQRLYVKPYLYTSLQLNKILTNASNCLFYNVKCITLMFRCLCKLRPPADGKPVIYICLYHLSYLRRRRRVIKNISACAVQKTVEIYSFFVYRFDILYFRCFNFINSFAT